MRMAIATSLVVALMLAIFAVLDLRASANAREENLLRHTQDIALTMRYEIEDSPTRLAQLRTATAVKTLSQEKVPLEVAVVPTSVSGWAPLSAARWAPHHWVPRLADSTTRTSSTATTSIKCWP